MTQQPNRLIGAMLRSFGFEPDTAMKGFEEIIRLAQEVDGRLTAINGQLSTIDAKLNTLYHMTRGEHAEMKNAIAVVHTMLYAADDHKEVHKFDGTEN